MGLGNVMDPCGTIFKKPASKGIVINVKIAGLVENLRFTMLPLLEHSWRWNLLIVSLIASLFVNLAIVSCIIIPYPALLLLEKTSISSQSSLGAIGYLRAYKVLQKDCDVSFR